MVSVKLSYWFRDRLHDVSSPLTALCSYMALDPLVERILFCTSAQSLATILGMDSCAIYTILDLIRFTWVLKKDLQYTLP